MRPLSAILFLFLLSFLWALGHTMDWTGQNHHDYAPAVVAPVATPGEAFVRGTDLRLINFDNKSLIGDHEQFEFAAGTKKPRGLSTANNKFLDETATYLKANPNVNIKLTGKYLRTERNTSIQDNMGVARAASVRKLLKNRRIATNRIQLGGQIVADMPTNEPISFNIIQGKVKPGPELVLDDMDFYFPTNSDQFTPTQQLINWANEAKKHIAKNPDKVVYITGHTDSDGTPIYNKDLGLRRARAVRTYLVNSGIKAKINIDSKGATEPVEPNTTAAGKKKNRRVNAKIK